MKKEHSATTWSTDQLKEGYNKIELAIAISEAYFMIGDAPTLDQLAADTGIPTSVICAITQSESYQNTHAYVRKIRDQSLERDNYEGVPLTGSKCHTCNHDFRYHEPMVIDDTNYQCRPCADKE